MDKMQKTINPANNRKTNAPFSTINFEIRFSMPFFIHLNFFLWLCIWLMYILSMLFRSIFILNGELRAMVQAR